MLSDSISLMVLFISVICAIGIIVISPQIALYIFIVLLAFTLGYIIGSVRTRAIVAARMPQTKEAHPAPKTPPNPIPNDDMGRILPQSDKLTSLRKETVIG